MRCGAFGHWAGDPQCKQPNPKSSGKGTSAAPAGNAYYAMEECDEIVCLEIATGSQRPHAFMAYRGSKSGKASQPTQGSGSSSGNSSFQLVDRGNVPTAVSQVPRVRHAVAGTPAMSDVVLPQGSDTVFTFGQHVGLTYHEVIFQYPGYFVWGTTEKGPSLQLAHFLNWVHTNYDVDQRTYEVTPKTTPGTPTPVDVQPPPQSRHLATQHRKKPPNPPLEVSCRNCSNFSKLGTNAYYNVKTCVDCGKVERTKKEIQPTENPLTCKHLQTDKRGSSAKVSRVFCLQCGTFVDEMPREEANRRKGTAEDVKSLPSAAFDVTESVVRHELEGTLLSTYEAATIMDQFKCECEVELTTNQCMRAGTMFDILLNAIEGTLAEREESQSHALMALSPLEDELECGDLPVVDVLRDHHVWAVLDEGCNSTICGQVWLKNASEKFHSIGFKVRENDEEDTKTFRGLSGEIKTNGKHRLPFIITTDAQGKDRFLSGVMETYSVGGTGDMTPLLLSKHAQAALGLVKDMQNNRCTIGLNGPSVDLACAKGSGLTCICLSKGFQELGTRFIPRQIRELAIGGEAVCKSPAAFTGEMASTNLMVLTAGTDFTIPLQAYDTRYDQKSTENLRKFLKCEQHVILTVNVMNLGDPHHDPNLRGHIGTHPETLRGVVQSKHSMEVLANVMKEAITLKTMGEKVAVLFYCRRNRHRSVACGWLIASAMQELLDEHFGRAELRHLNASTSWRVMNGMCRGTCALCQHETPDAQQQAMQCVDELVALVRSGKSKGEGINKTFYVLHPARQETVTVSATTCASNTPPLRSSRSTSTVALKPAPWKQAVETAERIGEDLLKQQQEKEEAMKKEKAPDPKPSRKKEDVGKEPITREEAPKEPEKKGDLERKEEHEKKEDKSRDKFEDLPRPPPPPKRPPTERRSRSRTTSRERRLQRQLGDIQDVVAQLQYALEERSRGRPRSRSDSRRRGRRSRTPPRSTRSERRSRSWSPNLASDSRGYRHDDYYDRHGRGGFEDYHRGRHEWSGWRDDRSDRSRSQWQKPRSPEPIQRRHAIVAPKDLATQGWPSYLSFPVTSDDTTTAWNLRVAVTEISSEDLDAIWNAAHRDVQRRRSAVRWLGPFFPREERVPKNLEVRNMEQNIKVVVTGGDDAVLRKTFASQTMRFAHWKVTTYDYQEGQWLITNTDLEVSDTLEIFPETNGRILFYYPPRKQDETENVEVENDGENEGGNEDGDEHGDGTKEEGDEKDENLPLDPEVPVLGANLGAVETSGTAPGDETREDFSHDETAGFVGTVLENTPTKVPKKSEPSTASSKHSRTPEDTVSKLRKRELSSDEESSDLEVKAAPPGTRFHECMVAMKEMSRTMSKNDKKIYKDGLKVVEMNDRVLEAMVGTRSLDVSTHLVVLSDVQLPTTLYHEASVLMTKDSWEESMKLLVQEVSNISPGLIVVFLKQPLSQNQLNDLMVEADMNECWVLVVTPHNPELSDYAWGFGGDLNLTLCAASATGDEAEAFEKDLSQWCQASHVPKAFEDALTVEFGEILVRHSETAYIDKYSRTCFAGEIKEDEESGQEFPTEVDGVPLTATEKEGLMLDKLMIAGAPESEARRRELWRKLPQRTRIAIRRLHKQFGHPTPQTLKNILKAGKASPELQEAARLVRCQECEDTAQKPRNHPVGGGSSFTYDFNEMISFDALEIRDHAGQKYTVFSVIDVATSFHMATIVKEGGGLPTSDSCAKALMARWVSWAGWPRQASMDRGLHNRGEMSKMLAAHGVEIIFAPLETPSAIGKCERHGGILKAMVRKMVAELETKDRDGMEMVLQEAVTAKNHLQRHHGFSPSQWVLGKQPRAPGCFTDESEAADLGIFEARQDPSAAYHRHHAARAAARRAFVHLDVSSRVARALTRNAAPQGKEYKVGDLVVYRRDGQQGGTTWSTASRVIGHDSHNGLWLLHEGCPVLCDNAKVRSANESEAMAYSLLRGEPVLPEAIVNGPQQKYLHMDDDMEEKKGQKREGPEFPSRDKTDKSQKTASSSSGPAVPATPGGLPDDVLMAQKIGGDYWIVNDEKAIRVHNKPRFREFHPKFDGPPPEGFDVSTGCTVNKIFRDGHKKTSETKTVGLGSVGSVVEADPWTGFTVFEKLAAQDPIKLVRAMDEIKKEEPELLKSFIAQRMVGAEDTGTGKVAKTLDIRDANPEQRALMMEARKTEWQKYQQFGAVVPIWGKELQDLLDEGHRVVPSKWVETDKHSHLQGTEQYTPKHKARLVFCGNFEQVSREEVRCDSPTAEPEAHHLIASWAASQGLKVKSCDITNAYFQAAPATRLMLMAQPKGGVPDPDIPPEACFICRVPVYGSVDAGRGFYLRMDFEVKDCEFTASKILPALYFLRSKDDRLIGMLATHVDDLLMAYHEEAEENFRKLFAKFTVGKVEECNFRYCGRRFTQDPDFTIHIDAADNTRSVKHIAITPGRKSTDTVTEKELTQLRSVTGSLAWVARYARPDLAYRVNCLQRSCNVKATVQDLKEANKVVDFALNGIDLKVTFRSGWVDWNDLAIVTFSDASFANEEGFKSQQGRFHYLTSASGLGGKTHKFHLLGFASSTLKRVCRATLQAEAYESAVEHGDHLRCAVCEAVGKITSVREWHPACQAAMKHVWYSDCMSLVEHLNVEVPRKCQDKRLGIELAAMRQSLWINGEKTTKYYAPYGDELLWIQTAYQVADCLTKSMNPHYMRRILLEGEIQIQ